MGSSNLSEPLASERLYRVSAFGPRLLDLEIRINIGNMETIDLLHHAPLFADLNKADLEELVPSTRLETYHAGRVIIREGRVGAAFFLITSGSVEVIKGFGSPDEVVVAKLTAGDFFGEVANMKHLPRSATVRALQDTHCLVVQRLHLDTYIEKFPSVLAKVEAALATRSFDD